MVHRQLSMATLLTVMMAHLLQDTEIQLTETTVLHQLSMATLRMEAMGHLPLVMGTLFITVMELHPQITATLDITAAKSTFRLIAIKNVFEDRLVQYR
jgi:hypothetical protein